jgi:hypothetical protein
MQRGADGLPAHPPTKPLLDPLHQPPQRGGGACSTVGGRAAAAWAHLTEAGLDLGAKGGRVR